VFTAKILTLAKQNTQPESWEKYPRKNIPGKLGFPGEMS
jgi:hypothetical protein